MPELIQVITDGVPVLVAVRMPNEGLAPAGGVKDVVTKVQSSLDTVFEVAGNVARSFSRLAELKEAKGAEVEFGLQLTAKGNVYVVESTGEASIKVKFTY